MDNYQLILNKVMEAELDSSLNVSKVKLLYVNNDILVVADDYVAQDGETLYWYSKVNGQNFLTQI